VGRPRSFFDGMVAYAQSLGAGGLGWVQLAEGEAKGPVARFLGPDRLERLKAEAGVGQGDAVFFSCDKADVAAKLAGQVRTRVGEELG
jgi:aspartyl-tRNA synthetase